MVKTKPIPELSDSSIINFWNKVKVTHDSNECWEWQAHRDVNGYGRLQLKGGLFSAHRVAYFLVNKIDPKDIQVLHHCDNPACCNNSHFFLGNQSDNMIDREKKGRANHPSGERHFSKVHPEKLARGLRNGHYTKPECTLRGENSGMAKLTNKDIINIRELCSDTSKTYTEIAKIYNVTATSIQYIAQGKSWKHLPISKKVRKRVGGSDNWSAKLNDKKVIKIRQLYSTGDYSYSELMKRYSIGKHAIACVIKGKTWKHLLPKTG